MNYLKKRVKRPVIRAKASSTLANTLLVQNVTFFLQLIITLACLVLDLKTRGGFFGLVQPNG